MFYAAEFKKGIVDLAQIKKDFQTQVGHSFDDFLLLDDVNKISSLDPTYPGNPSKYLLYNDPLCGIFDYKVDRKDDDLFEKIGTTLLQKAPSMGEYGYLFESLGRLASLLAIKNSLGARSREAYLAKDKKALVSLLPLYEECSHRLSLFIESFRTLWYHDNKPFGFDVQEIRLGGLALRLQEAKRTIQDYVDGETSSIPEFEVALLTQHPVNVQYDQKAECLNNWSAIASVNVIG
jgi:hexosaminidase